jgi:D-inositol-3-phosphate glycosyltransferase
MRKVRLFVWGDAVVNTGFSNVLHSIIGNLPQDLYEIMWLGVNYKGDPHSYPYKIYPTNFPGDPYGFSRMEDLVRAFQPDLFFLLNDPWIIDPFLEKLESIYTDGVFPPTVVYFPADAKEHDPDWYKRFHKVHPVVYSAFGLEVATKARSDVSYSVIPHGVDFSKFYRMESRAEARKIVFANNYDTYKDAFIFLNANRNQPRKRIDLTLKGFAEFVKDKPENVYLYMHSGVVDSFIHTDMVATRLGIKNRMIYSTRNVGPTQMPVEFLNAVYNSCDVGVNTSLGEGWGLCLFEDTPIWTKDGIFKIKDIKPGMEVITHEGRYRKVLRTIFTGNKKLKKIVLYANRYIMASENHDFYTSSGWKKVSELKPGDSVQLAKPVLKEENIIIDFAKDLRVNCNDERVWWKNRKSGDFTGYKRFVSITEDLGDIIGHYLAKGRISNDVLFIRTRTDKKALEFIDKFKELGVQASMVTDRRSKTSIIRTRDPLYVEFFRNNFGEDLRTKTVPDYFFETSLEKIVQAYVEYRYKFAHRKIFFYSFSDKLSSFLAFQFYNMNVPVTVKLRENSNGFYCEFTRSVKEKALPIKSNKVTASSVNKTDPMYWMITAIINTEELNSYDLEVEEDHSYVANGFVVHNCNVEHAVTGAPQIVPEHSTCKELFSDCGLVVPPIMDFTLQDIGTEGGLVHPFHVARAMDRIYKDKKLYDRLSAISYEKFNREELSWKHIAEAWNKFFLGVANVDNISDQHENNDKPD